MEDIEKEYHKDTKEMISDFNEAKFQIYRLNNLWMDVQKLIQEGDFSKVKWKLDAIWRELSADAKEKDGFRDLDFFDWTNYGKENPKSYIYKNNILNLQIAVAEKQRDRAKLYSALQKKEMFLRCLQDSAGKGAKRSSTEEDDIDE